MDFRGAALYTFALLSCQAILSHDVPIIAAGLCHLQCARQTEQRALERTCPLLQNSAASPRRSNPQLASCLWGQAPLRPSFLRNAITLLAYFLKCGRSQSHPTGSHPFCLRDTQAVFWPLRCTGIQSSRCNLCSAQLMRFSLTYGYSNGRAASDQHRICSSECYQVCV